MMCKESDALVVSVGGQRDEENSFLVAFSGLYRAVHPRTTNKRLCGVEVLSAVVV